MKTYRQLAVALLLFLSGLWLGLAPAHAATLTVTSAADSGAGSLRATIAAAAEFGDTINFAPALNGQTIVLTSGELVIRGSLNILGPGPTNLAISGNGARRIFLIFASGDSLLAGLTITNGNGSGGVQQGVGGGIYNSAYEASSVTVSNCILSGNRSVSGFGGGVFNGGTLTIKNSTLSRNHSTQNGGGILNSGTLTIQDSTLNENSATANGGGIFNGGGTLTVENSTLSGNTAAGGGGIVNLGSLMLRNSTLTGNRGMGQFSAGGLDAFGTEVLISSIVAGNFSGFPAQVPRDVYSFVEGASYNLIGAPGAFEGIEHGAVGNIVGDSGIWPLPINSILDTNLAFNGGPTRTHALRPSSPALNAGRFGGDAGLPYDQRGLGFNRIVGGNVDIGAYEVQATVPMLTCSSVDAIYVSVSQGTNSATVSWPAPTVSGSPAPVVTCAPPSGSTFALRTTLVTCTASNAAAVVPCTFTVTVCAMNITVTSAASDGPGSLRTAIANLCPGGTITFAAALNGQTLVLTGGELVIDKNLTILGPGVTSLAISGSGSSRVFYINPGMTCLLTGLTITDGNGLGALHSGFGGGLYNDQGSLTLSNCVLNGNSATGLFTDGGGIFNNNGTLVVNHCTLRENLAQQFGGGILNNGILAVQNSTISGNLAQFNGGGIANFASLAAVATTVTGNRAGLAGGGLLVLGTERISHCLVAGNFNGAGSTPDDVRGLGVGSAGYNLIGDASSSDGIINGVNGNIVGNNGSGTLAISSILDTNLAFNGGPTRTHALVPGSPAIDAGTTNTLPNAWQIADVSTNAGSGSLSYTRSLTPVQKTISTNSGWQYTVVSRLVEGSGGSGVAQFMIHGNGSRRFYVAWDTNAAGQLIATLGGGVTTNLTAADEATNYHTHELIYDPATRQATYRFDGSNVVTWAGLNDANQNGIIQWGSAASGGRGRMNYHHVRFGINGLDTAAEYFAGYQGSPLVAPNPTNQNWAINLPVTPGAVTNTPVSPDAVALWPGVVGEFALDFDQRGPGYPRRSGRAMDVGAVEFQASITALSFVLIDDAPAGMRLHLQGAPNETLSIQWNAQPGPGGWQPLTSGVTDVTGQLEYTDTSTVGQPQRFYRAVR